jgi:hypothetical protein
LSAYCACAATNRRHGHARDPPAEDGRAGAAEPEEEEVEGCLHTARIYSIHLSIYLSFCMYIYIRARAHTHTHIYISIYRYRYIDKGIYIYIYIYIYLYLYMYIYTCISISISISISLKHLAARCNAALRRACVSVPVRTPAGGQQGVSRPRPVEKAKPGRPNLAGLAPRRGGYLVRTAPPARTGLARREWAPDLPGYGQA